MINFLKYRVASFLFSALFISAGVVAYIQHGGFRYSVDFTGGTQVLFSMNKQLGSEELKGALSKHGWHDAVTREFGKLEVAVRVKEFAHDAAGLAQKMKTALEKDFSGVHINILEASAVGPGAGKALRTNSLFAALLGLLVMLLYIGWRFWSIAYGLGAVLAIFHDALAILTVFAIFNLEISPNVIGAIVATLGYSINDTIVIFARIRENFVKMRDSVCDHVVNMSINQTLRRTILTSFSTALVVGTLFVLGGETLRNLSLALLVGIVVGTYSSICIASPIMLMVRKR